MIKRRVPSILLAALLAHGSTFAATTFYVDATRPDDSGAGTNWATAKLTIQAAVDLTADGDTVRVADGTYNLGGMITPGYALTNRVCITSAITVTSENGPDVTIIEGAMDPVSTNGDAAIRCVYLANSGATLSGFTLTNGHTRDSSGHYAYERSGGGVNCKLGGSVSNCLISGNSAYSYGGGAYYGVLNDCTLSVNHAVSSGGGAAYSTMSNCVINGNTAIINGGGTYYVGTLYRCSLSNNTAKAKGGGAYSGTLIECRITDNTAGTEGGGTYDAQLDRCQLIGNEAGTYGGGVKGGSLQNCFVSRNQAGYAGGVYGSTMTGCTITYNTATNRYGGVAYVNSFTNCIVYHNSSANEIAFRNVFVWGSTWNIESSCTDPIMAGNGNIGDEPQFAGDYQLSFDSPCVGAGSTATAIGLDIDGLAWGSPPSMGCSEFIASATTGTLTVTIQAPVVSAGYGYPFDFIGSVEGVPTSSIWSLGDDTTITNQMDITHRYDAPGTYQVELRVYNGDHPAGVVQTVEVHALDAVRYVDQHNGSHQHPFDTWSTAATNIQDAIDACSVMGSVVLVTTGLYNSGYAQVGNIKARVCVTNAISLRSVTGKSSNYDEEALIDGVGQYDYRTVYLGPKASIYNFDIMRGSAIPSSYPPLQVFDPQYAGGGIYAEEGALISDCWVRGCEAQFGGGIYGGVVEDSWLLRNDGAYDWGDYTWYGEGGGAYASELINCTIQENDTAQGGGAQDCILRDCVVVGNTAVEGNGGGAHDSILIDCTINANDSKLNGGGCYGCTIIGGTLSANTSGWYGGAFVSNPAYITGCLVSNNIAQAGGGLGLSDCNAYDCTIVGNRATNGIGGGVYCYSDSKTYNCTIKNNYASGHSGGQYAGAAHYAFVSGNVADQGGGGAYVNLYNSVVRGNQAREGGGVYQGTLHNCTVVGNTADQQGGGVYDGSMANTIVYHNSAAAYANCYKVSATYSCSTPLPPGTGNIAGNPQLIDNIHIMPDSPCVAAGSTSDVTGVDYDSEAWMDPPAIGCDQPMERDLTGSITVNIQAPALRAATEHNLSFFGEYEGNVANSDWSFSDGTVVSNSQFALHSWAEPGTYDVVLTAYNLTHPSGVSATVSVDIVEQTYYVNAANASPAYPYDSWAKAATNIQDAVDSCTVRGAIVLVTNGTYDAGGRVTPDGALPCRVVLHDAIHLRAVGDRDQTIIVGGALSPTRCVFMSPGATLSGFTLLDGCTELTSTGYDTYLDRSGGGVYALGATVSNCVIQSGYANDYGGGSYCGRLLDCELVENGAELSGGGAFQADLVRCNVISNSSSGGGGAYMRWNTASHCLFKANHATGSGGGIYCIDSAQAVDCRFENNTTASSGGGVYASSTVTDDLLINCVVVNNTANDGAGYYAIQASLHNCLVAENTATDKYGGGRASKLYNCTVAGNSALNGYGGIYYGTIYNSIVYHNSSTPYPDTYRSVCYNSCISDDTIYSGIDPGSVGNITSPPEFIGPAISNYRLMPDSLCINAGTNEHVTGTLDLDGHPRIIGGTVDMGAYEYSTPPLLADLEVSKSVAKTETFRELVYTLGISNTGPTNATGILATDALPDSVSYQSDSGNGDYDAGSGIWSVGALDVGASTTLTITVTVKEEHIHDLVANTLTIADLDQIDVDPANDTATCSILYAPITHYVSTNGTAEFPYTSWATAAHTIQDAVNAAAVGEWVLVTNGVYDAGTTEEPYHSESRVYISKDITVRSVNGPQVTIIKGAEATGGGNGSDAVRGVYMSAGELIGFTITNGHTLTSSYYADYDICGGGINLYGGTGVVMNCILAGNSAQRYGGGSYCGTLNNCTFIGNVVTNSSYTGLGGGCYDSTVNNSTFSNNLADHGGGCYFGTLSNCTFTANTATAYGGGSRFAFLYNCVLSDNSAVGHGGGSSDGALRNCAIINNSARCGGGAYNSTLYSCTLTGNSAEYGGGSYWGTLRNCINYFNYASVKDDNWCDSSPDIGWSCTTPNPGGTGIITSDPRMASSSHIATDSPCVGISVGTATGTDIDGDTWHTPPAMGCDEPTPSVTGELDVSISANHAQFATNYIVSIYASITGKASSNVWTYGDGQSNTNTLYAQHAWAETGTYAIVVSAYNDSNPNGVSATTHVQVVAGTYYVDRNNPTPQLPYTSWATAATNIQQAVDAATTGGILGSVVLVTNGVYDTGGAPTPGYACSNRVVITNDITVRSVNGRDVTFIKGAEATGGGNGSNAVRCVYISAGTLSGFTITNGHTMTSGDYGYDQSGGGVNVYEGTGTVTDCIIAGNYAYNGAGSYYGTFNNCLFKSNSASGYGGASYYSTLNNCTLTDNTAVSGGGGSRDGTLSNCIITDNSAPYGGGCYRGSLYSCTVVNNSAEGYSYGGGVYDSTLNNCTIVSNTAKYGGGCYNGTIRNSIIYFNSAVTDGNNWKDSSPDVDWTCTTPKPVGTGNITNNPQFVDAPNNNYHLEYTSLCIDKGNNELWMLTSTDLDGNPRIQNDTVDMGAYESPKLYYVDLSLEKQVSDSAPNEGDMVVYTLSLTNSGPDAATGIEVTDALPSGVIYLTSSDTNRYDPQTTIWTVPSLDANSTTSLTITVQIDSATGGTSITNEATITQRTEVDANSANDFDSATLTVKLIDLSLAKSVNDPTPNEGDTVLYTLMLTNSGPDSATGIEVTDALPAGVSYLTSSDTNRYDAQTTIWTVPSLDANSTTSLTITVQIDSATGGTSITNEATITQRTEVDANSANDFDSATLTVKLIDLSLAKSVNDPTPNEGDTVLYTLMLTNSGPDSATGIEVTDALPAGVSYLTSSDTNRYDAQSSVWTVPALSANSTTSLTISVQINSPTGGTSITNTAAITQRTEVDANSANDFDTATLTVEEPVTVPIAPSSLQASVLNDGTVDLHWQDNADNENAYAIDRRLAGSASWTIINDIDLNSTTYRDRSGATGASYDYQVRALNQIGSSAPSETITVSLPGPPVQPSHFQAEADGNTIDLAWNDNSTNETGFILGRREQSETTWHSIVLSAGTVVHSDEGLAAGVSYAYRLQAFNAAGRSAYCFVSAATPASEGNWGYALMISNVVLRYNGHSNSVDGVPAGAIVTGTFDAQQSNPPGDGALHRVAIGFRNTNGIAAGNCIEVPDLFEVPGAPGMQHPEVPIPDQLRVPTAPGTYTLWAEASLGDADPCPIFADTIRSSTNDLTVPITNIVSFTPPSSVVRILNRDAMAGTTVSVPVLLVAQGDENMVSMTLNVDTNTATLLGARVGSVPNIWLQETFDSETGALGVGVFLPFKQSYDPGTHEILMVDMQIAADASTTDTLDVLISSDVISQRCIDTHANNLPTEWQNGTLTIIDGQKEGDVAPRPTGDGKVNHTDWSQMGRFVAGLDVIESNEFIRADCAAKGTLGDGSIDVADWVQVKRYAAGSDALVPAGGPSQPATTALIASVYKSGRFSIDSTGSRLGITNTNIARNTTGVVPFWLDATGNEQAIAFSIAFDSDELTYLSAEPRNAATNAMLLPNTAENGNIGIALQMPDGTTFPAGSNAILNLRFSAAPGGNTATADVMIVDSPTERSASDSEGNSITASWLNGQVTVTAPNTTPSLSVPTGVVAEVASMDQINLEWSDIDGEDAYSIIRQDSGGAWESVAVLTSNTEHYADSGLSSGTRYCYLVMASNSADVVYSEVVTGTTWTAIERWRAENFGTILSVEDSADTADWDGDGEKNLMEYALGRSPVVFDTNVTYTLACEELVESNVFAVIQYCVTSPLPDGVQLAPEMTTDLVDGVWMQDLVSVDNVESNGMWIIRFRSPDSIEEMNQGFFRLKAWR